MKLMNNSVPTQGDRTIGTVNQQCLQCLSVNFSTGGHRQQIYMQLCKLVEDSPVAEVIESVLVTNLDEFYVWYCHDFIRTVHQVTHKQGATEYKVEPCLRFKSRFLFKHLKDI